MRIYIDAEFIEDGLTIDGLSLALIKETGESLYYFFSDTDINRADSWVIFHVFLRLPLQKAVGDPLWKWSKSDDRVIPRETLVRRVEEFVGTDPGIEFWGYYSDYDWVLFCQLFGRMIDLPANFPMFCNDLRQVRAQIGEDVWKAVVKEQDPATEHSAFDDAVWIKTAHEALITHARNTSPLSTRTLYVPSVRLPGDLIIPNDSDVRSAITVFPPNAGGGDEFWQIASQSIGNANPGMVVIDPISPSVLYPELVTGLQDGNLAGPFSIQPPQQEPKAYDPTWPTEDTSPSLPRLKATPRKPAPPPVMKPCGWCGREFNWRGIRKHVEMCERITKMADSRAAEKKAAKARTAKFVSKTLKAKAIREKSEGPDKRFARPTDGVQCVECGDRFANAKELGSHRTMKHFNDFSANRSSLTAT